MSVPTDTEPPANGSPLFRALVRRQVRSLDWLRTPLRFYRMAILGPERAARRSHDVEWPRIKARIDAGHLAMVGLVRQTGWDPRTLTSNHQVLAYAYEMDGDAVTLHIYDPNWPGRDDVTVLVRSGDQQQGTAEPVRGVVVLP